MNSDLASTDGVDHINVYSKGNTALGRFLSNFYEHKIETEDGPFLTIEGYWYWLSCKDDRLRKTNGFESKSLGRELRGNDWDEDPQFKKKILKAIILKIQSHREMKEEFIASRLPLLHYYVYGDRLINVKKADWIIKFLVWYRDHLRRRR